MDNEVDDEEDHFWIVQHDPACTSEVKIADLAIGDSFIFCGKRFVKTSDMGWYVAILNCKSDEGEAFIHPNTNITLVQ
jgi:hypothetical protein